jgi:hypothetical protein
MEALILHSSKEEEEKEENLGFVECNIRASLG